MGLKKIKCIFVHGWGMNHAVWQPVVEQLPDWVEPVCIDLPGHGKNHDMDFVSLDDLVEFCVACTDEPAYWVGWSLGGMVVTKLALEHPDKVKAMMLVANSPCFIQSHDWPHGMATEIFDAFAENLQTDFPGTIQRFLSLQVQGSESGRQILRQIRKQVLAISSVNIEALHSGLKLLKTVDLRERVRDLKSPVTWVLGNKDALVKASLGKELQQQLPAADILMFDKASHAPFLSHRDQFNRELIMAIEKSC